MEEAINSVEIKLDSEKDSLPEKHGGLTQRLTYGKMSSQVKTGIVPSYLTKSSSYRSKYLTTTNPAASQSKGSKIFSPMSPRTPKVLQISSVKKPTMT